MITSAEEFISLRTSTDRDEYLRAANEAAPESVWLRIINDYPEMRKWVAHNKTVPQSILVILSQDADPYVRETVARKRKLDGSILEKLARDPEELVRSAVVYNAKAPVSVLRILADDSSYTIAEVAKNRLNQQ